MQPTSGHPVAAAAEWRPVAEVSVIEWAPQLRPHFSDHL